MHEEINYTSLPAHLHSLEFTRSFVITDVDSCWVQGIISLKFFKECRVTQKHWPPTSFPGSLILLPRASEERPWLGLVTCYFDNWEHQGGVLCNQAVCRIELCCAATTPEIVAFELKFQIVSIPTSILRLDNSVSRFFTLVVMLLPSYPLNIYGKSVIFQLWMSSSAISFWSDS